MKAKKKQKPSLQEKLETITAKEFGVRMAKVFDDSRSSACIFYIQQAFQDCDDDVGIMWEPFKQMLTRFLKETND